jgi:hypothetical protein
MCPRSVLDREPSGAEIRPTSWARWSHVAHALSSGICSLKEDETADKSVIFSFASDGSLQKTRFFNSVIRSCKRLTYAQAKLFLDENDLHKIRLLPPPPAYQTGFAGRPLKELPEHELRELQLAIRAMWSVASRLRAARMAAGSLDLDMPEAKIFIGEDGYPAKIVLVGVEHSGGGVYADGQRGGGEAFNNRICCHHASRQPTEKRGVARCCRDGRESGGPNLRPVAKFWR